MKALVRDWLACGPAAIESSMDAVGRGHPVGRSAAQALTAAATVGSAVLS
jgi:hypothetical protein